MIENPKAMSEEEAIELYQDLPDTKEHQTTKKTLEQLLNIKAGSD